MSTTASHEQYPNHQLPPSPPPSPPLAKRRHKRRQNSFDKLANTSLPSPPSSSGSNGPADQDGDSLIARIILTPILVTSFILSLAFVNLRDRAHRTYAHSSSSLLTYIYPSTWLDPEPYQDPGDSKWCRDGSAAHVEPHDAIGPRQMGETKKTRSWHLTHKIRKVAKLEIGDAFEMRGRIIAVMLAMMVLGAVVMWMVIKWLFIALVGVVFG